jgi:hypothetical protein
VSLQGSLDTFALPDVLVLLATTKKTGELHVVGNRSASAAHSADLQGFLWVDSGMLVGFDVARAADAPTAVFELLRLTEGSFSFGAGAPRDACSPFEIEPVLGEAQAFLAEWQEIERVVPSLSAWLRLAPEAPGAHVSMRSEQWKLVVAIGGGCDVRTLVDQLGQGELAGCRAVKELVEARLVEINDRVAGGDVFGAANTLGAFATARPRPFLAPAEEASADGELAATPAAGAEGLFDGEAIDEPAETLADFERRSTASGRARKSAAKSASARRVATPETDASSGPLPEAQALARQLASLGEEDEPAPGAALADPTAAEEEGDEPLNRGLLLKFLSSVRN